MPSEDGTKSVELDDTSNTTAIPEPPYSIFDKRQKWLIIIIASTAATCESVLVIKVK